MISEEWERLGYGDWRWTGHDGGKFFPRAAGYDYLVTKVLPMRIDRRQLRLA